MRIKKSLTLIAFLFISTIVIAQGKASQKLDKIIKKDYQIIECTISKISDKTVSYSLPNETLVIEIDVVLIAKIDFANGRSQTFNVSSSSNTAVKEVAPVGNQEAGFKENTIAVLPVPYVNSDNLNSSEEMAKFAQNDIYEKLIDKSANIFPLSVQDLRVTNSLLRKAGIDYKNIDETPIEELHKILGVDNIIAVKVSYTLSENQTATTYTSGKAKVDNKKIVDNSMSTTNSYSNTVYNYHIYFDMYKNNTKIYTESRVPFLKVKDSWMDSVQYLLKRSPIYKK
jgi:hypothetical protein